MIYLLGTVVAVGGATVVSYLLLPAALWLAIPGAVGLYSLYRGRRLTGVNNRPDRSTSAILEQPLTKVLYVSVMAVGTGTGLLMSGMISVGVPFLFLSLMVLFVAFGLKLNWTVQRASNRGVLAWDILSRGSLLAFGMWVLLEAVVLLTGRASLGLPTRYGNILVALGVVLPAVYLCLERTQVRARLLELKMAPVTQLVRTVPERSYWRPPEPPAGEAWRQVTKPDEAPSVGEDPSNRPYTAKR